MAKSIKYLTVQVAVDASVGEALIRQEMDRQYDRVTGIYVPELASYNEPIRLGIKDDEITYQQRTNLRDYIATVDVSPKDRFKDFDIPAAGNHLTLIVQRVSAPTAHSFDVVIRLEKDL